MNDWKFEETESTFSVIPEGSHRIRFNSAERVVSSKGNDMLAIKFDVSGQSGYLFYNLVFLEDRPEITNRNLTNIYKSFKDIPMGELDENKWIGKVGACEVIHEEWNGKTQARVDSFISADKQNDLPPWVEPERKSQSADSDGFTDAMNESVPFL